MKTLVLLTFIIGCFWPLSSAGQTFSIDDFYSIYNLRVAPTPSFGEREKIHDIGPIIDFVEKAGFVYKTNPPSENDQNTFIKFTKASPDEIFLIEVNPNEKRGDKEYLIVESFHYELQEYYWMKLKKTLVENEEYIKFDTYLSENSLVEMFSTGNGKFVIIFVNADDYQFISFRSSDYIEFTKYRKMLKN